jgi:sugar phosphate isomerase/epimerase
MAGNPKFWPRWAAAIALLIVCLGLPLRAEARGRHYLIGLQLYTVRDDCAKDFPGTLKAVAQMGFSGVEFAGYYGRTAEQLKAMLDEDHLKCYGTHIGLDALMGDNFDKTVAFNKVLGNKLLVIPGFPQERTSSKEAWIGTAKLCSELAKKLAKYGMVLGYHNHEMEFKPLDGELPWNTFFDNADRQVAIQFDIGNAMEAGAQAAPYLTKFPGRVISVHVKDFSSTNPNALLGEGDEHWNEVIPILKAKNGPRWFIIEQETYPFPSLVCAEKCLRTFEKMLKDTPR